MSNYISLRNARKIANQAMCVNCDIMSGCPGGECPVCSRCLFDCDCSISPEVYRSHRESVITALNYARAQSPIWTRLIASPNECQCACYEPCYCAYFKDIRDFPHGHAPSKDLSYKLEMWKMINNFSAGRYNRQNATEFYWTLYEH